MTIRELSGRVALVVGGSGRGIGRSVALTLAREGADIALTYRRHEERAHEVVRAIEADGVRALAVQADATLPDDVQSLIDAVHAEFGHIDILVVTAGGRWDPRDIVDIEPEHWRAVLAAEIDAPFLLMRALLPEMRERGWGRIVLIGGLDAGHWRHAPPDAPIDYPLGKAARHWLARTLGPQEIARGVTVNAVAPGPFDYPSGEGLEEAIGAARGGREWTERRQSTPQDAAEAIAWLCGDAARYVTGEVIEVRGKREV